MTELTSRKVPFVERLEDLANREDRGALAALRRGLGQPAGTVSAMYPWVVPWLPENCPPWTEATYYTVASLFALHPSSGRDANLGVSLRRAGGSDSSAGGDAGEGSGGAMASVERRLVALLAANSEDLPGLLRQAISLLRSKEIPVNWHQLFLDLQQWGAPSRRVQRTWAAGFWGRSAEQDPASEDSAVDQNDSSSENTEGEA
ncbi:MAG: type I-E CRISPR-associated protein Cse2/CasB [Chloroflexi bacterium]|jgi:CRISPR system Cascade subunit CasB|nr:type I-E CRISPR-associated protein Cse2/CasB [Chloroflexota bacterium]